MKLAVRAGNTPIGTNPQTKRTLRGAMDNGRDLSLEMTSRLSLLALRKTQDMMYTSSVATDDGVELEYTILDMMWRYSRSITSCRGGIKFLKSHLWLTKYLPEKTDLFS